MIYKISASHYDEKCRKSIKWDMNQNKNVILETTITKQAKFLPF